MFVTNWISTTKIQKISEITNFFRHYFLSRTEVGLDVAFSLEADYKSALKWSSLFCLRISNPQERLAGLRFLLSPSGLAFPLVAWRACVSPANYVFDG